MKSHTIHTCKTCFWWDKYQPERNRGQCMTPAIETGWTKTPIESNHAIVLSRELSVLNTGPNFGCVHYIEKTEEEQKSA